MPNRTIRIDRREVLRHVTALLGGSTLVGSHAFLAGCATAPSANRAAGLVPDGDIALLDEIAETILPETDTPGAKAAGVGPFMALMIEDSYSPLEQRTVLAGLESLERECEALTGGRRFLAASPDERLTLLTRLDREQHEMAANGAVPAHYFRMLKELAVLGYFTSEIGYTEAMRYRETPGRWDPCVPLEPGETLWAPHA